MVLSRIRRWKVDEFYQMAQTGLLQPDEQVELLEGQIIQMTPQGPLHAATTDYTADLLKDALLGKALIRVEKPLRISDYSEPQPDVAVVHLHPRRYADEHPRPDQVYLLVEISDSSLDYDCETKASLYAQARIHDYWVLDARNRQLTVFRDPQQGRYTQTVILDENARIAPSAFPNVELTVKGMLLPAIDLI
ncbi:MAG TPA: Uma2 family endonuclease [Crinalium sp.]|jgi:Uma2 family endonuclease